MMQMFHAAGYLADIYSIWTAWTVFPALFIALVAIVLHHADPTVHPAPDR